MQFQHRFTVNAPLDQVVEFHRHASGLKALTPPIAFMRFHHLPYPIQQGDTLTFTMWLGIIPVFWESCFPEVSDRRFIDTQGRGPFKSWQHIHTFIPVDAHTTEIHDQIEAHLDSHLWRKFVGLLMWSTLPILFWYRKLQTRRLLGQSR